MTRTVHCLISGFIAAKYYFGPPLVLNFSKTSWWYLCMVDEYLAFMVLFIMFDPACTQSQCMFRWLIHMESAALFTLFTKQFLLFWCTMSGIYKCTFTHKKLGITKEQLAGKVLPHLIPLSIENNLNLNQVGTWLCCMLLHDKLVENRFKLLSEQNSYITVCLCLLWKQPNKTKKPAGISVFMYLKLVFFSRFNCSNTKFLN